MVNYPVTIRLTDIKLDGVHPRMNTVATFVSDENDQNRWLVPTTALREQNGQFSVHVVRGENVISASVNPLDSQGEWTVVESPTLREGDSVIGHVTSYVGQEKGVEALY